MTVKICEYMTIVFLACWTMDAIHADCGLRDFDEGRDNDLVKRLVGGEPAARREFPWQVRLRSFGQLTYSGVLIEENWVLTAASCFNDNYTPSLWTAVLNDLSSSSLDPGEKVIYVESIFLYGGFKRGNFRNNLALVKLKTSETADIKPACIANGTEDLSTECVIVGWGSTGIGEAYSETLKELKVKLFGAGDCPGLQTAPPVDLHPDQLCVTPAADDSDTQGPTADGSDTIGPCIGDRGSPVLCKTGERWSVVGVVSEEYACNLHGVGPPVVLNLAHFSSWINKIISHF